MFETPITLNVVESVKYKFFQPYWSQLHEPYPYSNNGIPLDLYMDIDCFALKECF